MTTRRAILTSLGGLALLGAGYGIGAFGAALHATKTRHFGQSTRIMTAAGFLEYAIAGDGPVLMMIHGTGGGFDQGLLFAAQLRQRGFRIIAPSRFGYLGSDFPIDASPAHQADVLAALLDHLGIDRLPIVGGSAGALIAAEFALRHPDRSSHLGLLVPAANLTNRDPVIFTPFQRFAVGLVLGSDFWFWLLSRLSPDTMIRTLLATDPALLDSVAPTERQRAEIILDQILPVSRKLKGFQNDAYWAGAPSNIEFERINAPTLIISCEDDLFGTADTARLLARRINRSELAIYPTGGHIWLGRDDEIADRIAEFVAG